MLTWQDDVTSSGEPSTPAPSTKNGRPDPVLEVVDLSAGYGGPPIVSGLSLQVGKGEIVTIVGPNGAGKSTLVKAIIGELPAVSGTVRLGGQSITGVPTELLVRRGIGYVPQRNDVFGMLTVRENLEIGGYLLAKREVAGRIDETLSYFERLRKLADRRVLVNKMSG